MTHTLDQPLPRTVNTLYVNGLIAEYSLVKAHNDEWVAVASVRASAEGGLRPTWVTLGAGTSPAAAVRDLRDRLHHEAVPRG